jgi:hypothetical protein
MADNTASNSKPPASARSPRPPMDDHVGAVEGDRPTDYPQQGNDNAPALDEEGMPNDPDKIAQDVIGANLDETEGG